MNFEIKNHHASAFTDLPMDVPLYGLSQKYDKEFREAERYARKHELNIWGDPELTQKYLKLKSKWGQYRSKASSPDPNVQTKEWKYVASKNSRVFHRPDCKWAKRISPKNFIGFKSREEAMESKIKWLSQDIDYVGFLREKLAGLSGFLTMAKELVQNADDEKAKFINFDFYPEKLIVKNPSRFSEIDFKRMQNIASGGKRLESGKTGTFGVGFISVYQVTDHPELLSSGRHWVFHPENTSNERIQETPCDIAEHTEFHLPWAFEVKSDVRLRLGRNALTLENVRNFLEELYSSLPQMLLFLRTLNRIEILNEGKTVASCVREIFKKDGYEEVWINTQRYKGTNSTQCWIVFRRPFDVPPIDLAGANKENEVAIAFPGAIEGNDKFGLLYNYLPTPISTAFNFHINGDFFPTPDRRNIVLEGPGYETEWNSHVIGQIALLFVDNFANLKKIIGFEDFYAILPQLEYKSPSIKELEQIRDMFLKKARNSEIVYSSTDDWHTPEKTFFLDGEHERLIHLLEEAGLKIVNPSLRQYRNLFTHLGVSVWGIKDLIELVSKQDIEPGCILSDVPLFLSSIEKLNTLLSFVDLELSQQKEPTRQGIIDELKSMPLGLCGDEKLYPFNSIYYADESVQKTFSRFNYRPKFGHSVIREKLDNLHQELEPKFDVSDAISYCEKLSDDEVLELYLENILQQIWDYLATNSSEIIRTSPLMNRFRALKIFLTKQKEQFRNLENLSLPGNYSDPIGLDIIIDTSILSGKVLDLLKKADLKELDFRRYFLEHIPKFLESEEKLGDHETKFRIAKEVKQHFSEIDSPEVRESLGALPIILCNDNSYHFPGEVYLHSEELDMVFDGGYLQPEGCYYGEGEQGWNEWFKTIGVNTSPRGEDVEQSIRELITTLNNENISKIEKLFYYLGERFEKLPEEEQAKYHFLKSVEWLPAEEKEDRYYLPSEVYAPFNKHLFSSQALFIPFRQMRYMRTEFLNFIEIGNLKVSEVDKVAKHLLWLSEEGEDYPSDIYRYLSDNLNRISEETLLALKKKPVIFVDNEGYVEPKKLFWNDHQFGPYRFKLSEDFRPYYPLFSSLDSKESPEYIDYIEVLLEISDLFGKENRILDDVTQKVVKQIYSYLAFECPINSEELRKQFCEKKVVLNARGLLSQPEHIFFADKSEEAEIFGPRLGNSLITKEKDTWRFLSSIGVRPISKAVEIVEFDPVEQAHDTSTSDLIRTRSDALLRIVETQKADFESGWDLEFISFLQVFQCDKLRIEYAVKIDGQSISSGLREDRIAHYDENTHTIYVRGDSNESLRRFSISKVLARAINPEIDPSHIIFPIREILDPAKSVQEVHQNLDQGGFDRIAESPQEGAIPAEALVKVADVGADEQPSQYGEEAEKAKLESRTSVDSKEKEVLAKQGEYVDTREEPFDIGKKAPDQIMIERLAYLEKRREFEKRDIEKRREQSDYEPIIKLTPEDRQRHKREALIFYNRQIRDLMARVKRIENDKEIPSIYTKEWPEIAKLVKERDGYQCRRCGISNEKAKLVTHHIISRKKGGSNWPSNLITLCETCHGEVEHNPWLL